MWSDNPLDEWERVIIRERHRSPDAAAATTATTPQFFADTRIAAESYRGLVAEVAGPDPDDNAHMAAAVAGQVESLRRENSLLSSGRRASRSRRTSLGLPAPPLGRYRHSGLNARDGAESGPGADPRR